MTETTSSGEGRTEERTPSERLLWHRENSSKPLTGWVSDITSCSVAFVTPTRDLPILGEAIDLTFGAAFNSAQRRSVKVARTEPYDKYFSLVDCSTDA